VTDERKILLKIIYILLLVKFRILQSRAAKIILNNTENKNPIGSNALDDERRSSISKKEKAAQKNMKLP